MRNLIKILVVIGISAACTRSVYIYATCAQVNVPCACSATLHGIEGCDHGQTTGQCLCIAPVTPTITITGNPQALSSAATYTATVNSVDGLNYSWSVSGGTFTSGTTGPSITFTAGAPGVALITANVTNSGGDTAAPAVLGISIVAPPATLGPGDISVPTTITENRTGIPLRVLNPVPGLTYVWSVDGNAVAASVPPAGILGQMNTTDPGALIVHVYAQNSVGAQSNTLDTLVTVVPRQVESFAGATQESTSVNDGQGSAARFGGPYDFGEGGPPAPMGLVISSDGATLYVGDINSNTLRRVSTSNGTVKTIAGGSGVGIGAGSLSAPVIAALDDDTLIIGESASKDGDCPLWIATNLASGATLTPLGKCGNASSAANYNNGSPDGTLLGDGGSWSGDPIVAIAAISGTVFVADSTFDAVYEISLSGTGSGTTYSGAKYSDIFDGSYISALAVDGSKNLLISDAFDGVFQSNAPTYDTGTELLDLTTAINTQGGGNTAAVGTPDVFGMAESSNTFFLSMAPHIGGFLPGGAIFSVATSALLAPTNATLNGLAGPLDAAASTTPSDGAGTTAAFVNAGTMVISPNGATLYIADALEIRALDIASGNVTTLAGSDAADSGNAGSLAHFNSLTALAVGPDDTVYVSDSDMAGLISFANNDLNDSIAIPTPGGVCKLKSISPDGTVTTITGGSCFSPLQNGPANAATQGFPWGLTVGTDGMLYDADWFFSQVRRVTPSDLVATAAGTNVTSIGGGQYDGNSAKAPVDGFTQSASFYGPTALATAPDGTIAVADYYYAADADRALTPPQTDSFDGLPQAGDPYGLVRFITGGQVLTVTPPCSIPASAGAFSLYGILNGCIGQIAALGFDQQGGVYALAQAQLHNGDIAPGLYYMAPPDYQTVLLTGHAIDQAGGGGDCQPAILDEPCLTACMRQPPLMQGLGTAGFLVAGLAVDPSTGDVFFTDQELIRRVHRTDTSCSIDIVAGSFGVKQVSTGLMPQPANATFNNLSGLAISPSTLDLYATDSAENVVLRVRY